MIVNRLKSFFVVFCLAFELLALIPTQPVYASSLVVDTKVDENDHSCVDGDCSLRDAIETASAGDTINFSITGAIVLSSQLNVTKDMTIVGPGPASLTLDGNTTTRIFSVKQNTTVQISGLTVTNGKPSPLGPICGGGGIHNLGNLTLDHMVITGNDTTLTDAAACKYPRGGGILVWDYGSLTITNSSISNNISYTLGGGIFFQSSNGTLNLTDVDILGNTVTNYGAGGLAVYKSNGVVKLERVNIANNTASNYGNGLYIGNDSNGLPTVNQVDIVDSYIHDNDKSDVDGAGVVIAGPGLVNIQGSLITNNAGRYGGGIYISDYDINTVVNIDNSTISENSASDGGGLYINGDGTNDPTININNSTIAGNTDSSAAGGLYIMSGPSVNVSNTILADNLSSGSDFEDCSGTLNSLDYNLLEVLTGCTLTGNTAHNWVDVDPNLSPLADNGGFTSTMALLTGSPAIDTGSDAKCSATDQRGMPRPQGSHCDIGAYEAQLDALTYLSAGANDGWVLESTETSNKGKTLNNIATTLRVGDDAANRQYRSVLSFDTSALPDNAVIATVKLQFKYAGVTGANPFSTHGKLLADICMGTYKGNAVLEAGDFNAACSKNKALIFSNTKLDNWYSRSLNPLDFQFINLTGDTQVRLRFTKDDNNDFGADFIKIYGGDAEAANQPQLIIGYYLP